MRLIFTVDFFNFMMYYFKLNAKFFLVFSKIYIYNFLNLLELIELLIYIIYLANNFYDFYIKLEKNLLCSSFIAKKNKLVDIF